MDSLKRPKPRQYPLIIIQTHNNGRINLLNIFIMEKKVNNNHSELKDDGFNSNLKNLINQINSIKEIVKITYTENESFLKLCEDLTYMKNTINEINANIKNVEKEKKDTTTLNSQITDLRKENQKYKKLLSSYGWITRWGVLFAFIGCIFLLLISAVCIEDKTKSIAFLIGGILVFIIFVFLFVALEKYTRTILMHEKE